MFLKTLDYGTGINYEEGGYKMGKLRVPNLLHPNTSRQGKPFRAPTPFFKWVDTFLNPFQLG